MAYQNDGSRPQRQMFDISGLGIVCAECGTAIKELPFQPTKKEDDTYGKLYCYDCNKNRKRSFGSDRRGFGGGRNRF